MTARAPFIIGLPTWGTLIGLEHEGRPVIGIMNQPYLRERFWSDGKASYFKAGDGGQPVKLQTRRSANLATALAASTHPEMFKAGDETAVFEAMMARVKTCRFGTDCYAYCLLAAGLVDIVIEAGLKPYDIVALIPIIENAGGIVTSWDGGEARGGGRILAAAHHDLHREALELIAQHMNT